MKKLLCILLVVGLVLLPSHAQEKPKVVAECVIAVVVIAIGIVVVYGIVKMCKAIPAPPAYAPRTNAPNSMTIEIDTTNGAITVQSSQDMTGWSNLVTFTITASNGFVSCQSPGYSSLAPATGAVFFLPPLPSQPQTAGFFRLLSK